MGTDNNDEQKKANAGQWEVDHKDNGERGSERYDYYFIMNEDGNVVCDTFNSEIACIKTESDENGSYSWDEQGEKDMKRLVECRNALAGVPDPQKLMDAIDEMIKTNALDIESYRHRFWERLKNLRAARGTAPAAPGEDGGCHRSKG